MEVSAKSPGQSKGELVMLRRAAREIFVGSLEDCSVKAAARAKWHHVAEPGEPYRLALEGFGVIDLMHVEHVLVIAVGKAAGPMLQELLRVLPLPPRCALQGVLLSPEPLKPTPAGISYFAGGHPLPNQASLDGAKAALASLQAIAQAGGAVERYLCFFLISGGASSMMEVPLDEAISLSELIELYQALLHSGADIAEMNCVRKHVSAIKGGRLRAAAGALRTVTIAVSDVPRGALDVLGSGPTLPDGSTLEECHEIVARFGIEPSLPASVRSFFASARCVETPKPGAWDPEVHVLLSSEDLAEAAQRRAEALGFHVVCDHTPDNWDYRAAAEYLLEQLRELRGRHARVCLISAGEVTVVLPPKARVGTGGRNQQFALYLASLLRETDGTMVVLSGGV